MKQIIILLIIIICLTFAYILAHPQETPKAEIAVCSLEEYTIPHDYIYHGKSYGPPVIVEDDAHGNLQFNFFKIQK